MKVPTLRFKEFTNEEWNKTTLGEITTVLSGLSPSKFNHDKKDVPYLRVNDLNFSAKYQKYFTNYVGLSKEIPPLEKNIIIFPKRGAAISTNKIRILEDEAYVDTNLMGLKVLDGDREFLFYYLLREGLYKIADTSTIPQINNKHITPYIISLPTINEQKKIASFFTLIDRRIEKQQERVDALKEQKKGLLQKIFSKELRFKDEEGKEFPEWEVKQLNEISSPVKRTLNEAGENIPILTISAGRGFMEQTERFSQVIAGSSLSKYTLLYKNELSYNRGASKAYPYGCIYSLKDYDKALIPNVYRSFTLNDGYCSEFYAQLFSTGFADYQLRKFITSTARMDGLLNISQSDFFSISIPAPQYKEQQLIASFFSELDRSIEVSQSKLDYFKEQKKGLMQQMFV